MRVKMMAGLIVLLLAVVVVAVAGCKATRSGYESAPYRVVLRDGKFEVRDYPALTLVETLMSSGGTNSADGSFNRLFRFITGNNEASQKIAMTTPVFMSGNEKNRAMAFVMPAGEKVAQVPKPKDATVTVREVAAGRYAIFRYSGGRNAKKEAEVERQLRAWMQAERLPAKLAPVFGYFDPPWIPAFLRRNEVMLLTESSSP